MKVADLFEDARPHYKKGQELIVSGKEGFDAHHIRTFPGGPRSFDPPDKIENFSAKPGNPPHVIIFDSEKDGKVFFLGGRNMWSADANEFYANVLTKDLHFIKSLHIGEATKDVRSGTWTVHNLVGTPKKFSDIDSVDARAWMKNKDPAPAPRETVSSYEKQRKEWAKQDREEAREARRLKKQERELANIWNKVQDAVGDAWPDGDPLDRLVDWMEENDITMEMIDKATRKYSNWKKAKGFYDYLALMWDEYADAAIHDVMNGHIDPNSPYYDVGAMNISKLYLGDSGSKKELENKERGGKPPFVKHDNPWR